MNGFFFADTPALLSPDPDASALRADVQAYWPQRASLFALLRHGLRRVRAHRVAVRATMARHGPCAVSRAISSLDAQGRVRRVLPLAQFQSGRPVALGTPGLQPIDSGGLIGER